MGVLGPGAWHRVLCPCSSSVQGRGLHLVLLTRSSSGPQSFWQASCSQLMLQPASAACGSPTHRQAAGT